MTDAAFREALTDYANEVSDRSGSMATSGKYRKPGSAEVAALARVLALYAERQGAEYEICHVELNAAPHEGVTLVLRGPFSTSGKMAGVGDRVRVTKVEEGT